MVCMCIYIYIYMYVLTMTITIIYIYIYTCIRDEQCRPRACNSVGGRCCMSRQRLNWYAQSPY